MNTPLEAQHTPGPWKVEEHPNPGFGLDVTTDERTICQHIDVEADARLIASAPTLLEALRKLVQDIRDFEEIYPIQLGSLGLSTRIEFLAAEKAIRDAEGKI